MSGRWPGSSSMGRTIWMPRARSRLGSRAGTGRPSVPGPFASRAADWPEYFACAAALMAANPPPVTDLALLRAIAPLGLPLRVRPVAVLGGRGGRDRGWRRRGASSRHDAAALAAPYLSTVGPIRAPGWATSTRTTAIGPPWRSRAWPRCPRRKPCTCAPSGSRPGDLHDGDQAPGGCTSPRRAACRSIRFWSLSLYEATEDGQFFFTDNPLRPLRHRRPYARPDAERRRARWISGWVTPIRAGAALELAACAGGSLRACSCGPICRRPNCSTADIAFPPSSRPDGPGDLDSARPPAGIHRAFHAAGLAVRARSL